MREIKFRAWDSEAKVMSGEFSLFGEFTLMGTVHDWQMEIRNIDTVFENGDGPSLLDMLGELKIMQFTGLKDKNGVEIYEGDIVRILYTDWASQTPDENGNYAMTLEEYKVSKSTYGYVAWDYHGTGWVLRSKSKYSVDEDGTVMTSIIHGTHGEREVIGNIYEAPSLTLNPKGKALEHYNKLKSKLPSGI